MCDKVFTKSGNFTNHKQSPTKVKLLSYDLLNLEVPRLFYNDNNKEKLILQ